MKSSDLDVTIDKIDLLKTVIEELQTRGLHGNNGMVWPVIVQKANYDQTPRYIYPSTFFWNLMWDKKIYLADEKPPIRRSIVKILIDYLMADKIDIHMYHFFIFCVYRDERTRRREEDLSEKGLGKRKFDYVSALPQSEFYSDDDFISAVWAHLIERRDTHIGDHRRNPALKNIRLLFTPEQFGAWTGSYYSNADWVEPLSSKLGLECQKWTREKDPMAAAKLPEGWIEGPVVLGHEGAGSLRHFVRGEPINAGRAIQVKFGDGWIAGRYEWQFEKDRPIQVHSGDEVLYIREGHLVRVRG
jgi:hypothetical protein